LWYVGGVARALISKPECVLADEPVSSLDPQLARQVLGLLKKECANSGCTVLCALHDKALSDEFSDATLRLRGGGGWDYSAGGKS
jgi:phosphonate transport system ATP-binding protein